MTSHTVVHIVSGGAGASADQLTRTALAQFAPETVPVSIHARIETLDELAAIVTTAQMDNGLIVHTLVDPELRDHMIRLAQEHNIVAVDLIGPLLRHLARCLQQEPRGQPGLYRQLHEDYFKRIDAIEFTVAHDDGRKPHELDQADVVLTGVSRVGKTPLSIYLSTQGWKVANVPLVPELDPPAELFTIDRRRVVALSLDPHQLLAFRRLREHHLGIGTPSPYSDPAKIEEELRFGRGIFRRGKFTVVNITDKPIEEAGGEVIALVQRQLRA